MSPLPSWTVHTWFSETAPANSRGLARIQIPGRGGKVDWSPVVICAPTQDEARVRANQWIADEVAKAEAKANRPRKGGRPKKGENTASEPDDYGEAI